ncbi:MAG: general secretion pathway protein H [Gammaproteobacteria bacterium]|jgi:general secretion pathway protein H
MVSDALFRKQHFSFPLRLSNRFCTAIHPQRRPPQHNDYVLRAQGFSLLEVLLVLAILAIAAALILPALVQPSGTQLRTTAGSFAAGLRRARNEAVNTHNEVRFMVDLDAKEFQFSTHARRRSVPAQIGLSVFTARSEVLDNRRAAIRFFPDGSSTGGRITLSAGERRYHVDVDWMTGQVRVRAASASSTSHDAQPGLDLSSGRVRLDS